MQDLTTAATPSSHAEIDRASVLLVVNKRSRQGAEADLQPFIDVLATAGMHTETVALSRENTLDRLLERRRPAPDIIVVAGGDGTVCSVAESLCRHQLPFGLLPLGTANDLARSLGVPPDIAPAAEVIARGQTCRIDVATANGQYFFNVAGIGLGPAMTRDLATEDKSRWGALSYLAALCRTVRKQDSFKVTITCDGERLRLRALQLTVANGKYYGGGMTAGEHVQVDDGKLDLIVVKAVSALRLLGLGPVLRWGKVAREPDLVVRRAERIQVSTRKRMPVSTDGELTTETPVQFAVHHRKVRVFVSDTADAVGSVAQEQD